MITKLTKYRIEKTEYTADELRILRDAADAMIRTEMEIVSAPASSLRGIYFGFYDQLPKWIAERAKANWDGEFAGKDRPRNVSDSIMFGFHCAKTKEGQKFWYDVLNWLNGHPHPPFPPDVEKPAANAVFLGCGGEFEAGGKSFDGWTRETCWLRGRNLLGTYNHLLYAAPADSDIVKLNYGKGAAR